MYDDFDGDRDDSVVVDDVNDDVDNDVETDVDDDIVEDECHIIIVIRIKWTNYQ